MLNRTLLDPANRVSARARVGADEFDETGGGALAYAMRRVRRAVENHVKGKPTRAACYYITYEVIVDDPDSPDGGTPGQVRPSTHWISEDVVFGDVPARRCAA